MWTGQEWDKLSETFDFSIYMKTEDAEQEFTKITDYESLVRRVEALENNEGGNS